MDKLAPVSHTFMRAISPSRAWENCKFFCEGFPSHLASITDNLEVTVDFPVRNAPEEKRELDAEVPFTETKISTLHTR
jgi:hypothetical protein